VNPTDAASVGTYTTWFKRAVWIGIVQNMTLGIPAIFAPERVLKLTKQRPTGDPVWSAFAGQLLVLLSLLYIPGAQDPHRYRKTACLSVFARACGVGFFLGLRRGTYPLFGFIDAFMFLIQAPLLFLASREQRG
jgi:hypothetical protein